MRISGRAILLAAAVAIPAPAGFAAENTYVEPGTLRLSHELAFEQLFHRTVGGFRVDESDIAKTFPQTGDGNSATRGEFGATLLTEAAARFNDSLFARALFEVQGDYADRYWRSVNENHRIDLQDRHSVMRQVEANLDREEWYAHGFYGVGHDNWEAKGDFFALYPAAYPDNDYLGHSGSFGVYPDRYKQDLFLNISGRHVPQGFETGGRLYGIDGAVAYGDELAWGLEPSLYARAGTPAGPGRVTAVMRNEQIPSNLTLTDNDTIRSGAVSYDMTTEDGQRWQAGLLYSPYRSNETYTIARPVEAGEGLLGSSWKISRRTAKDEDGIAARLKLDRHGVLFSREWVWMVDLLHAGVLAGNKDQLDFRLGTDILQTVRGAVHYTYRRPVEGPVPLLREGTVDNPGAIVAQPRGPESPFTVNWANREAVFVVTTISYDPTPGTSQLIYDPEVLQAWNLNKGENASLAFSLQHRMSDYRTSTDRQTYYNETGDLVFDSPARAGAWATDGFIHEGRILAHGRLKPMNWILGVAVGQQLALSNVAYSDNATKLKPITDYYSIEGRLNRDPFAVWAHYGSGVWAPDPVQQFFGESYDRLWGLGGSWNITTNTAVDVSYLAARQDDELFTAPTTGSFDELRMIFSHRFGFLFLFQEAARPGYRAQ